MSNDINQPPVPQTMSPAGLEVIERWTHRSVLVAYFLLIGAFAVILLLCSFGPYKEHFNSDAAASVLYGHEMIVQRTLFPQWNNATGVMFSPIMPHLLVQPLVLYVVADWFHADRIAVAIDQAIMLGLIWWVLGRVGLSRVARLFLVALLLIAPSYLFLIQTTLLAGKSWLYVFLLLIAWLAQRVADADRSTVAGPLIVLCAAAGLVFVDMASAATILPGLCAALALEAYRRAPSRRLMPLIAILGLVGAVVVGQVLLRTLLAADTYTPYALAFIDPSVAGGNLQAFVQGLLLLFGAVPAPGTTPYSLSGAAAGAKFVMLLITLTAPIYATLRPGTLGNPYARVLAVACSVSLLIRVYIYLFTGISLGDVGTARYFIVELLLGLTVLMFYVDQYVTERYLREPLLLAAILPFAITAPAYEAWAHQRPTVPDALMQQLAAEGLHYGYADFWDANATTAASNGGIRIRAVTFEAGTAKPYRWLSSDRWYRGDPAVTQSVLLLRNENRPDTSVLEYAVGAPQRTLTFGDHTALVYPFDLATRLETDWAHPMKAPLSIQDSRAQVSAIGTPRVDATTAMLVTRWAIRNDGDVVLTSYGNYPVNLGLHSRAADGHTINHDLVRQPIPALAAHAEIEIEVRIPLSAIDSAAQIEADLVQEGVAWFGDRGSMTARIDVPHAIADHRSLEATHDASKESQADEASRATD